MKNTRVAGHGLLSEGAAFNGQGDWLGRGTIAGFGRCSCGEQSPWLPNTAARARWHVTHKADMVHRQQKAEG